MRAWLLLLLSLGLATLSQMQFDNNRHRGQQDDWLTPSVIAVVASIVFGYAMHGVPIEPAQSQSEEQHHPSRVRFKILLIGLAISLVATLFFAQNTIRLAGLILWLGSLALALYAIHEPVRWKMGDFFSRILRSSFTSSWHVIGFTAVLVVAITFRFYRLDEFPAEIALDQIHKIRDITALRDGVIAPIFFPGNQGRESGFFYLAWLVSNLTELNFEMLKVTSALIGVATVIAMYFAARSLFNRDVALIAMLFISVSKWDVILSRSGFRVSLIPLFILLTMLFLSRALRKGHAIDFALMGVTLGAGMYTYKSFPSAILAAFTCLLIYALARRNKSILVGAAIAFLFFVLVYSPMARYAIDYWEIYTYREQLQAGLVREALQNADVGYWEAFANNLRKSLLMFNFMGDPTDWFNIPPEPHLNYFEGVLFILGLGYASSRFSRGSNSIVLIFLSATILPMAFSMVPDALPNIFQSAGSLAPALILAALPIGVMRKFWSEGASTIHSLDHTFARQTIRVRIVELKLGWLDTAALIVLLLSMIISSHNTIFVRFANTLQERHYPNSLVIANEIRAFHENGPSFYKYFPGITEATLIEMRLRGWGIQDWAVDKSISPPRGSQIDELDFDSPPLNEIEERALFILDPRDQDALQHLRIQFPKHFAVTRFNHNNEPLIIVVLVEK